MKKTFIISGVMLFAVAIIGITNWIIGYLTYGSFNLFEIFYLVCTILGGVLLIWATRIELHSFAGVAFASIGLIVNTLFWANKSSGVMVALNLIVAIVGILAIIYFSHSYFKVFSLQKFILIPTLVFIAAILAGAIACFIQSFAGEPTGPEIVAGIFGAVSLLATCAIPVVQYLVIKNRK